MKKLLLLTILLLSGCGQVNTPPVNIPTPEKSLGATEEQKITAALSAINSAMTSQKTVKGKYEQIPWQTIDGMDYKIDEYKSPKGATGYIVTIIKNDGTNVYSKVIATGDDALLFNKDWQLEGKVIIATSTK